tara:strand:- start:1949 stop:2413 length:465 start_codon:yes stop_codon:yes gene_type:complete
MLNPLELDLKNKKSYLIEEEYNKLKAWDGWKSLSIYKLNREKINELRFEQESYNEFFKRMISFYEMFYRDIPNLPSLSDEYILMKSMWKTTSKEIEGKEVRKVRLRKEYSSVTMRVSVYNQLLKIKRNIYNFNEFLDVVLGMMIKDRDRLEERK